MGKEGKKKKKKKEESRLRLVYYLLMARQSRLSSFSLPQTAIFKNEELYPLLQETFQASGSLISSSQKFQSIISGGLSSKKP